jgi:beta-lactamase superfamily II metal-dependent hydrolase
MGVKNGLWNRSTGVVLAGLSTLSLFWSGPRARGAEMPTRWTMVNVCPGAAQADCHIVQFPDGSVAVIDFADAVDAPGRAMTGLRRLGVGRIGTVVITHFHFDHYRGIRELVASGVRVDRVVLNVPDREVGDSEKREGSGWDDIQGLLFFLRERHVPYVTAHKGDRLVDITGGPARVTLDVVSVYDGIHTPIGRTSVNDTSIILRLSHGPTRVLFTGDLGSRMGLYLATHGFDLAADVLKVSHHGAVPSAPAEFLDRVGAKAALVPAPKTLWWSMRCKLARTYFAEHHIPTYVSGIDGNVTVVLTTSGFTIKTEY